jgi:hypothetical protein
MTKRCTPPPPFPPVRMWPAYSKALYLEQRPLDYRSAEPTPTQSEAESEVTSLPPLNGVLRRVSLRLKMPNVEKGDPITIVEKGDPITIVEKGDTKFKDTETAIRERWETLCSWKFQGSDVVEIGDAYMKEMFDLLKPLPKGRDEAKHILYVGDLDDMKGFAIMYVKEVRHELPPDLTLEYKSDEYYYTDQDTKEHKYNEAKVGSLWKRWEKKHPGKRTPSFRTLYVPVMCALRGTAKNILSALERFGKVYDLESMSLRAGTPALVSIYKKHGFEEQIHSTELSDPERCAMMRELNLAETGDSYQYGRWMSKPLKKRREMQ